MKRYEKQMINIVNGLNENLDAETKKLILEECGRKCIRDKGERFIQKANALYKNSSNLSEFLTKFKKTYDSLHFDENEVAIIYPKCLCPVINKIPVGEISPAYCNCSRGWVKELFEGILERPVEVLLEESITKGNKRCKLKVLIEQ